MKYVVQITKQDGTLEQVQDWSGPSYQIAASWLPIAEQDPEVKFATIIRIRTEEDIQRWHQSILAAVMEHGEEKTFRMIERALARKPDYDALSKQALGHPAIKCISAGQKMKVESGDKEQLMQFVRLLLSTLATHHELKPVTKGASLGTWAWTCAQIRQKLHPPSGEKVVKSRAEVEAERAAKRLERLEAQPPKGRAGQKAPRGKKS